MPKSIEVLDATGTRKTKPLGLVWSGKYFLWSLIALTSLFVLFFYEIPILNPAGPFNTYRIHLISERVILFPHVLCGTIAFLAGPLQFSTRLRRRNPKFHRILGRTYAYSVFAGSLIAIYIAIGRPLFVATCVHAGAWFVCTLVAILLAQNRQIIQHRQWMIRSYAVTFSFIVLRVLKPWHAYANMSVFNSSAVIIVVTFLSVTLPDIAFDWRQLTTRRA